MSTPDPYDLGYTARKDGKTKTANPYADEDRIEKCLADSDWTEWMNGWEDANDDIAEGEEKEQHYQWQTVSIINGRWPLHDPDEVHPLQAADPRTSEPQPFGTLSDLKSKRPKDLDIGLTAWRLRKVRT